MRIWDRIKNSIHIKKEKRIAKKKEKLLIKATDDEFVVGSLPAEEDNSAIDIHAVVQNMEDPQSMVEVVRNNLEEIIEQDNVRDTFVHLEDEAVLGILEEKKEELIEQKKIVPAIQAIAHNEPKLEAVKENLEVLTGLETATILNSLEQEREEKRAKRIENRKVQAASEQILRMLVKYGHVSQVDINEMAATLQEESSKLAIAKLCIAKISKYDVNKKKNITSKAKAKMVYDLLKITNVEVNEKCDFLARARKDKYLTKKESEMIQQALSKEMQRIENLEIERQARTEGREEYE